MRCALSYLAAATPTTGPLLSSSQIIWVAFGIGVIGLLIVLQPWLLARTYHARRTPPAAGTSPSQEAPSSFFQIPYITWFLIHHGIAALALLAIVFLGVDNVIDKGTVSALIGSLLGYAIGSAANSSRSSTPDNNAAGVGGSGKAEASGAAGGS